MRLDDDDVGDGNSFTELTRVIKGILVVHSMGCSFNELSLSHMVGSSSQLVTKCILNRSTCFTELSFPASIAASLGLNNFHCQLMDNGTSGCFNSAPIGLGLSSISSRNCDHGEVQRSMFRE